MINHDKREHWQLTSTELLLLDLSTSEIESDVVSNTKVRIVLFLSSFKCVLEKFERTATGSLDKQEVYGGQEWGLNISVTPGIIKAEGDRRLENGIDNLLSQNR